MSYQVGGFQELEKKATVRARWGKECGQRPGHVAGLAGLGVGTGDQAESNALEHLKSLALETDLYDERFRARVVGVRFEMLEDSC